MLCIAIIHTFSEGFMCPYAVEVSVSNVSSSRMSSDDVIDDVSDTCDCISPVEYLRLDLPFSGLDD